MVVDGRFQNPQAFSSLDLALSTCFYAFQIYGDFAGYSFIAIGIATILGFDFGDNFNRPYFATSFSDFWQRWHISLSRWLRDYLYIPLGGNRGGTLLTYRNLMLTMTLGGLWHGAKWTFIVWGLIHGFYLCVQRLISNRIPNLEHSQSRWPGLVVPPFKIAVVFVLTCVAWIFFRANSVADAWFILMRAADITGYFTVSVVTKFNVAKGVLLIMIVVIAEALSFVIPPTALIDVPHRRAVLIPLAISLLLLLSLFGTFGTANFIYFQF